jgi:quercetin dioxygenase-like cupin family protein
MGFLSVEGRTQKNLFDGVAIRTYWGERIMLSHVNLAPDAEVPSHSHPHEQAGVVLDGELILTIASETRTLREGEMYIVPGNMTHSARGGPAGCTILEVFSPVREEYKY